MTTLRPRVLLVLFFLVSVFVVRVPGRAEESGYRIESIAPGIYAALQPEAQRFNDSNSVLIVGANDVVVVDSQSSPAKVRRLIGALRELTDKPVRFVINTHWHGDHVDGNQAWQEAWPEVEFVGHHTLRTDILERAAPFRKEQIEAYEKGVAAAEERLAKGLAADGSTMGEEEAARLPGIIERTREHLDELRAVRPVTPTLTYEGEMVLDRGGREIRLLHFVAHSRGDTVVFLPQEKILITGDLLDELPFGGHGYPSSWIETLDRLHFLDFERIVPGHGGLFEGKGQLLRIRRLLMGLRGEVRTRTAAGEDLEEIRNAIDLSAYREEFAGADVVAQRNFDAFLPALIERMVLEAHGKLEDPLVDPE